jgi:hypothetical protein
MDFLSRWAGARRKVLRAELLLESALECGDLLGRVLGYPLLGFGKGVGNAGVLVARAVMASVSIRFSGCFRTTRPLVGQTYAGIVAM